MGRNSGGVARSGGGKTSTNSGAMEYNTENVGYVAKQLSTYAREDRWNRNTEYQMGFNAQAQDVIDKVADAKLGFASDVAGTVRSRNYTISDKQAYVIANAAVKEGMIREKGADGTSTIFRKLEVREKPKKNSYATTPYVKSSTKIEVGSRVNDKYGSGTIVKVLTKSTGYVSVRYDNGTIRKQMAFNLKGADGNYLKKKPN